MFLRFTNLGSLGAGAGECAATRKQRAPIALQHCCFTSHQSNAARKRLIFCASSTQQATFITSRISHKYASCPDALPSETLLSLRLLNLLANALQIL